MLALLLVAPACGSGGDSGPPAASTGLLDLEGQWQVSGEFVAGDHVGSGTGTVLDGFLAGLSLVHDLADARIYDCEVPGVARRTLDGLTSIHATQAIDTQLLVLAGILHDTTADVTITCSVPIDLDQMANMQLSEAVFVVDVDYRIYDGDVIEVVDRGDGPEWSVSDEALLVGGGRVRLTGAR